MAGMTGSVKTLAPFRAPPEAGASKHAADPPRPRYVGMQEDLWAGRLKQLEPSVARWKSLVAGLGALHESQFAFTGAGWAGVETVSGRYFAKRPSREPARP